MFIVICIGMQRDIHENGSIRVLLVDDEQDFTDVLSKRLTRRGLAVRTACDGGEAFSMIERESYDVVVLDVGLPDVSGMQLLKAIKLCSSATEVIMLTGGDTGSLESCMAGAYDLLSKPAKTDILASRIMEAARSGHS